ncbi:phosphoglycolate phosphatase [Acinetobacter rudis]|uniref:phosphoglycolate phosphatase n=1 Tax=Acinetobacter rudis TaxID=632955 RepID=A0AAW8JAJ9_9GAMM|nr:phosphoglycolate phosphatase [Acinetobacter rudis]MDQ8935957.1 phosphoglycolate phosphatase [Acinetobacter rudis]MDQ8953598.1 phosphoglycolate phosphatase [Acinetobacter rudis]MDQ9018220.1 phosphoglycolate phosphatase [Acinetobacter rudis]
MCIANLAQRKVILFDLDGTLVDSAGDLYRAMNLSLERLALPQVTEAQVRVWIGKGTAIFCQSVLKHIKGEVDPLLQQQLLATFLEIYNADPCVDSKPFPGIMEFLQWGQQQEKIMICVTNKPELPARQILDDLAMSEYFVDVIGGDRFELRKPDPIQLLYCAGQFAENITECLMIGDSINDIEAARRAGMDCIAVSYGYNHGEDIRDCQPQQVVANLTELLNQ